MLFIPGVMIFGYVNPSLSFAMCAIYFCVLCVLKILVYISHLYVVTNFPSFNHVTMWSLFVAILRLYLNWYIFCIWLNLDSYSQLVICRNFHWSVDEVSHSPTVKGSSNVIIVRFLIIQTPISITQWHEFYNMIIVCQYFCHIFMSN